MVSFLKGIIKNLRAFIRRHVPGEHKASQFNNRKWRQMSNRLNGLQVYCHCWWYLSKIINHCKGTKEAFDRWLILPSKTVQVRESFWVHKQRVKYFRNSGFTGTNTGESVAWKIGWEYNKSNNVQNKWTQFAASWPLLTSWAFEKI